MSIIKQAKLLIRNGDKTQAENLLIKHLKVSPEDEKAWLLLAEIVERKRHKINCLNRALAVNPKNNKTKKSIANLIKGKSPKNYRSTNPVKLIGVLIFGLVLPLFSVAGVRNLLRMGVSESSPASPSSSLIAQPLPLDFSFDEPVVKEEVLKSEAVNQIIKGEETVIETVEETVKESFLDIPNIPSAYCVPSDTIQKQGIVISVMDAHGILVNLAGEIVSVRYLGIETPGLDELGGSNAFEVNRSLEGQEVLLVADGLEKNDDGDLLSYVFAGDNFVNYQMLEWGLATISTDINNFDCIDFFVVAENSAKEKEIGVWQYIDIRMDPAEWKTWPVIPLFSKNALEILQDGLDAGRDPEHFSIMGDCQAPEWLMFGPLEYQSFNLPENYSYLQSTLDNYSGQWSRNNVTVESGNTVASLFSTAWADPNRCGANESPIDCELRRNNPTVSLIMLGTNWPIGQDDTFDGRLRQVISYLIDENVLPIIVTKGDATEPDYPLNKIMAKVAYDFDIPLWNFWAGIQDLENHGIDPFDARNMHISTVAFQAKRWEGVQTLHALQEAVYGQQE